MILNFVWLGLFLVAGIFGLFRFLTGADPQVFPAMAQATFDSAKTAFEIAIGLVGTLTLWLGLMKVGEAGGAIRVVSRLLSPLLSRMFPGLPPDHPAAGSMVLNFAANLLGLDNAATPAGLKAIKELETLNPHPGTATDHQIMFMALHAASLTLFPVSIMAIRASAGAKNPADIFLPVLIASLCSALGAFLSISLVQKIKLRDPILLAFLFGALAVVAGIVTLASTLPHAQVEALSSTGGAILLFAAILWFLILAALHKVNAWEAFTEGAKDGFCTAIQIVPFLVGILVAVGVFRASGAMAYLVKGLWALVSWTGIPQEGVGALPTMILKPLSGGGARGLAVDCMKAYGVDSFAGRLASVLQGSTDTTLYVLALYAGAAGLKNTRYALPCMLFADVCGFVGAIAMALLFFT
jgi:spore maturation protein SpmA